MWPGSPVFFLLRLSGAVRINSPLKGLCSWSSLRSSVSNPSISLLLLLLVFSAQKNQCYCEVKLLKWILKRNVHFSNITLHLLVWNDCRNKVNYEMRQLTSGKTWQRERESIKGYGHFWNVGTVRWNLTLQMMSQCFHKLITVFPLKVWNMSLKAKRKKSWNRHFLKPR